MTSQRIPAQWALEHLHSKAHPTTWTYGCELELSDWDRNRTHNFTLDRQDFTMVNSNGIAVDPTGRYCSRGGEICTRPTESSGGQAEQLAAVVKAYPETAVNYRSNLHIHVRVPGLRNDLARLKQVLQFNLTWLAEVLPFIDPIPVPSIEEYPTLAAFKGAQRRARRRKSSHHHLPTKLAQLQLQARSAKAFYLAGVPHRKDGTPMWGVAQRDAVDLKQLLQTDTVEFRHFPGTLSPEQLRAAVEWCRDWLGMALGELVSEPLVLFRRKYQGRFPSFAPYQHQLEVRYRATVFDGTVPLSDILKYQAQILAGTFKGSPYYA